MEIVCLGSNFYGQLGLGARMRTSEATPALFGHSGGSNLDHSRVADVQCGSLVTVVLDHNGQIQQAGCVNGIVQPSLIPKELVYPLKATQVACGNKHILALLDGGYVCSWGTGFFGQLGHGDDLCWDDPRLINALEPSRLGGCKVVHVACGGSHSGAIAENGRVFMWGLNRNSQCGLLPHPNYRREEQCVLEPMLTDLSGLCGDRPTQLACGKNHSACVGISGRVYTWGAASFGRLGQMDARKKVLAPQEVPFFHTRPVAALAVGDFHSIALTRDASVYSWGYNADGQCGHGNTLNLRTPRKIEELVGLQVEQVTCGASWSSAVTSAGFLYSWGYAEGGWTGIPPKKHMAYVEPDTVDMGEPAVHTCAFDSNHNILRPTKVKMPVDRRVTRVCCGSGHAVIFCRPAHDDEMKRSDATSESMETDSDGGLRRTVHEGESDEESLDGMQSSPTCVTGGQRGLRGEMTPEEMEASLLSWVRHKKVAEVSMALARGVNVEASDDFGNTPLMVAVQNGHTALVAMLIEKGANVACRNSKGNTPLHYAYAYKFTDIGRALVVAGADEYVTNNDGLTPFEGLTPSDLP